MAALMTELAPRLGVRRVGRQTSLHQGRRTLGQMMLELLSHLLLHPGAMEQPAVHRASARLEPRHGDPIRKPEHLRSPEVWRRATAQSHRRDAASYSDTVRTAGG